MVKNYFCYGKSWVIILTILARRHQNMRELFSFRSEDREHKIVIKPRRPNKRTALAVRNSHSPKHVLISPPSLEKRNLPLCPAEMTKALRARSPKPSAQPRASGRAPRTARRTKGTEKGRLGGATLAGRTSPEVRDTQSTSHCGCSDGVRLGGEGESIYCHQRMSREKNHHL